MHIVSIVFDKFNSEYTITHRDSKTGKLYSLKSNHLLDKEKLWARDCKNYNQTPYNITWF